MPHPKHFTTRPRRRRASTACVRSPAFVEALGEWPVYNNSGEVGLGCKFVTPEAIHNPTALQTCIERMFSVTCFCGSVGGWSVYNNSGEVSSDVNLLRPKQFATRPRRRRASAACFRSPAFVEALGKWSVYNNSGEVGFGCKFVAPEAIHNPTAPQTCIDRMFSVTCFCGSVGEVVRI